MNKKDYRSHLEERVGFILTSKKIPYIPHYRDVIINPKTGKEFEIDLYIPEQKIGIEVNSFAYHSFEALCKRMNPDEAREYHKLKCKLCEEKGIQLFHLWEDDLQQNLIGAINLVVRRVLKRQKSEKPEIFLQRGVDDVVGVMNSGYVVIGETEPRLTYVNKNYNIRTRARIQTDVHVYDAGMVHLRRID